jgi:hypothetical protein
MTKDFKQLDYAILVGEWGQFAVVEKDKKVQIMSYHGLWG